MIEKYMNIALMEARKSFRLGEVPIGCVIVKNNKIISKAHNIKEKKNSALCHAELLAISKANKKLKNWRLDGCDIYITMQPCPMCASAIKQSRISKIFYGVKNINNALSDLIFSENDNNRKVIITDSIMQEECKKIVQEFFKQKRE